MMFYGEFLEKVGVFRASTFFEKYNFPLYLP